ncbi:MAG: hypothetical protein ACRCWS_03900 [Propionibacteriaceae bacterium]
MLIKTQLPRKQLITAIGCASLVLAAIIMVLCGLPEKTIVQKAILQASGLVFAGAIAFGLFRMDAFTRLRHAPTKNFTRARYACYVLCGLGFVLYAASLTLGKHHLSPLGQFFIWIGVLVLFAYVSTFDFRHRDHADSGLVSMDLILGEDDDDADPFIPRRAL